MKPDHPLRQPILITADHSRHPVILTLTKFALFVLLPIIFWALIIRAVSPFIP